MVQRPHVIWAGGAWGRGTLCWVGGDLSVIKHGWLVACPGLSILPCVCPEEARGEEEGDASATFIWLLVGCAFITSINFDPWVILRNFFLSHLAIFQGLA